MANNSPGLQGRCVLVTGGTQGIGRGVVQRLAASGARAIAAAIDVPDEPQSSSGELAIQLRVDVRNEQSVERLFARIEADFGGIDALVHCAGVGVFKPLTELSASEWDFVVSTNLTGAFLCTREAIRMMLPRGGGRIVHIGSVSDHIPLAGNGAYASAKAGLGMLTQIINEEHKANGIRATHLTLGAVYTDIWRSRPEFSAADMLSVSDVAETICDVLSKPAHVRMDRIVMLPPKGVL